MEVREAPTFPKRRGVRSRRGESGKGFRVFLSKRRYRFARIRATMDAERKVEALGALDRRDEAWSARLDELVAYYAEHGSPTRAAGAIGMWVAAQRTNSRDDGRG